MKTKIFRRTLVLLCVAALLFAMTGCAGKTYTFEAEHTIIKDGNGPWNPVTQAGVEISTEKGYAMDGISNICDGASLTWKITADKAAKATVTLHVASHLRTWGTEENGIIGMDDVSKGLSMTLNGNPVAISGSIPGGNGVTQADSEDPDAPKGLGYLIAKITVEVDLVAGENVITFTTLGTNQECNLYMDKLEVQTTANLTFTETDNSSRVWGM